MGSLACIWHVALLVGILLGQAERQAADLHVEWKDPQSPLRSTRSLDGTWSFAPEGRPDRDVRVPCFWEALPDPRFDISCPGYLAGTPDQGLEIDESHGWEKRTIHRGAYTLALDIPHPARVTHISFEALHHQADVFINDRFVGHHVGPYWRATFDITEGIVPGKNVLRVELMDGLSLLGEDGITDWPVGNYAHTDMTGIYRSVTLEELPKIYVSDVFIVPSVRRGDLTVQVTVCNQTDAPASVVALARAMAPDGTVALETGAQHLAIPAKGSGQAVIVQPWPRTPSLVRTASPRRTAP